MTRKESETGKTKEEGKNVNWKDEKDNLVHLLIWCLYHYIGYIPLNINVVH